MMISHHAQTLAIGGKLFLAPLKTDKVQTVLDVGTGTGIWAMYARRSESSLHSRVVADSSLRSDFGDEFPDAQVIGTDISPIQPSWVPPNVRL